MTDLLLTIITLSVIALHVWYVREKNKEVSKLINAVIAKNPLDMQRLDIVDKMGIDKPIEDPQPDLIPETELSLADWEDHIIGKSK